jgi:hypothetical protein
MGIEVSMSDYKDVNLKANLLAVVELDVPQIAGKFHNGLSPEVPCPKCGGKSRFRIRMCGDGVYRVFCSHCGPEKGLPAIQYLMWRDNITFAQAATSWETSLPLRGKLEGTALRDLMNPLSPEIAMRYYRALTDDGRKYFRSRGISDEIIDRHKLGWKDEWGRFTVPEWRLNRKTGEVECWGIKCRLTPWGEKDLMAKGEPVERYWSEKGSHHGLLNAEIATGPVTFIVEGGLDALAMTSLGYDTVASPSWDTRWNRYIKSESVVIIADRDESGVGDMKARDRLDKLGRGKIVQPPEGCKDIGEFIQSDLVNAQMNIYHWAHIPPTRK